MLKLLTLVLCVSVVVAIPPTVRSDEDLEAYQRYLEKAKPNNGELLEDAMAHNPKANAWENSGKYEGDILVNDEQRTQMLENFSGKSRNALIWPQVRWPQATIIWEFAGGHFSGGQQNAIWNAIRDIEANTCVRFRQRTNERDFVRLTNFQDGCYAHVGFWVNFGVHTMNLANGCFNHFIIIHEWLHVVGLMHMHQATSRDNYIWVNWGNIQNGLAFAFERNPSNEVTMLNTPYEYASNLHYGSHAFSANGQPTIVARFAGGESMGQLQFVTGWDWVRVRRMYNCPGAWSEQLDEEDTNKPAEAVLNSGRM